MSHIISVSDDVYNTLKGIKGSESYSAAIRRLLSRGANKESVLSFFGKGSIDDDNIKEVRSAWKRWNMKYV